MGQKRWSTPGGSVVLEDDFGSGAAGIVTTGVVEPEKWTRLNVTSGVDMWLSGKSANCGFLMRLAAGAKGYVEHYTSEIEDPSLRPKLTLEYEGTVKGQEAVVPEDLQWLLHEAGRETESDTKVEGTEI
jgi:hypothetical protein